MKAFPLALLLVTGLLASCRTASFKTVEAIAIPPGISVREVQAAMVIAISSKDMPEGSNWEKIVDALISAKYWDYRSQFGGKAAWFIESIESDAVVLGFREDSQYLRVRMSIGPTEITPTIARSSNLDQAGDFIHKDALIWIQDLSINIRAALGRISTVKADLGSSLRTAP